MYGETVIFEGIPKDQNKRYLLLWVRQSQALIRIAREALQTTERPEFWDDVIDFEQAQIKEIRFQLGELKNG